jgi:hypothetical protein
MPNQIIASNKWIQDDIDALRTVINSGHTLKLFQNNVTPDPSKVAISFFTVANWDTYANQALTSDFAASTKIVDGEYQILSTVHVFAVPGSGSQTIYGWWIDDGSNVKLSYRFDSSVTMSTSNPALAVQIAYQQWAKSLL